MGNVFYKRAFLEQFWTVRGRKSEIERVCALLTIGLLVALKWDDGHSIMMFS
jgi:hypothetical protein